MCSRPRDKIDIAYSFTFHIDFVFILLQKSDILLVASFLSNAIIHWQTFLFNSTNYQHIVLDPPFVVNIPKFHTKIKKINYFQS